jgi:hypothetical protein
MFRTPGPGPGPQLLQTKNFIKIGNHPPEKKRNKTVTLPNNFHYIK